MLPKLPVCCDPKAFDLMARNLGNDTRNLINCACAVVLKWRPDIKPEKVWDSLQSIADTVRQGVKGKQPQALLTNLHQVMFEGSNKFGGNVLDYYNPTNCSIVDVLESRKGGPAVLSMIYVLVARFLGFRSWGIGLPGHFLAGIEVSGKKLIIDSFDGGRLMDEEDCWVRAREMFGDEFEISPKHLKPFSNRSWITRIAQNLLNIFGSVGRYLDLAAILELEILLWPEQSKMWRDLGLLLGRIGMNAPAVQWLSAFLMENPDDAQADDLRQLVEILKA